MSRHRDYVLNLRSKRLNRAIGFAGDFDAPVKSKEYKRDLGGRYYYYGPKSKTESVNRKKIIGYISLPIIVLFAFGFNPILGFLSILGSILFLFIQLKKILNSYT
ncbi:MAG: hypothetical protein C4586_08880 [Anaerolineaceae bacterium]|nr:MAG: hypothetical protein C4586_08880 [Anaerolineaceae bacterium]